MSALNWLMPERVGRKCKANGAFPVDGEYVVDIDNPSLMRSWGGVEGFSVSGLQLTHDKTRARALRNLSDSPSPILIFGNLTIVVSLIWGLSPFNFTFLKG